MPTCPQCGQPVRPGHALCPFCGTNLATGETPERKRTKPGGIAIGMAVGCGLLLLLYLYPVFFIGATHDLWNRWNSSNNGDYSPLHSVAVWLPFAVLVTLGVGLAVALRRRFPDFARGMFYSMALSVALWLGALYVCH